VAKFNRMLDFGAVLPDVRAACLEHLLVGGASRETVLAAAVRLLDLGCSRIGSDRSATENETFGITTLGRRQFGSTLRSSASTTRASPASISAWTWPTC